MTAPEWHAFKLASALGMVATKPTPKARDIIPNEVWEVARRMPDIDWKCDATHLAEARQLVTQLKRISYAET